MSVEGARDEGFGPSRRRQRRRPRTGTPRGEPPAGFPEEGNLVRASRQGGRGQDCATDRAEAVTPALGGIPLSPTPVQLDCLKQPGRGERGRGDEAAGAEEGGEGSAQCHRPVSHKGSVHGPRVRVHQEVVPKAETPPAPVQFPLQHEGGPLRGVVGLRGQESCDTPLLQSLRQPLSLGAADAPMREGCHVHYAHRARQGGTTRGAGAFSEKRFHKQRVPQAVGREASLGPGGRVPNLICREAGSIQHDQTQRRQFPRRLCCPQPQGKVSHAGWVAQV